VKFRQYDILTMFSMTLKRVKLSKYTFLEKEQLCFSYGGTALMDNMNGGI
jgi:hypothetical protein